MKSSSWAMLTIPFIALLIAVSLHVSSGLVDWYGDSTHIAQRGGAHLISGAGILVSGADNPTSNRADFTITTHADSGAATIAAGATTVATAHSLGAAAQDVLLGPTTDTLGARFWVSSITATHFTIEINAAQASDISFSYRIQGDE